MLSTEQIYHSWLLLINHYFDQALNLKLIKEKQKIKNFADLISVSRIEDFEELFSNLRNLFVSHKNPDDLYATFLNFMVERRKYTRHTILCPVTYPNIISSELSFDVFKIFYPHADFNNFVKIFLPDVTTLYTIELELDRNGTIDKKQLIKSQYKAVMKQTKIINEPDKVKELTCDQIILGNKVNDNFILPISEIVNEQYQYLRLVYNLLTTEYPKLYNKILLENYHIKEIYDKIELLECLGLTLRQQLEKLIKGLLIGGEKNTGKEDAHPYAQKSLESFNDYLDACQETDKNKILAVSYSDSGTLKSLQSILNDLALGSLRCVEIASGRLTKLLNNKNNESILNEMMTLDLASKDRLINEINILGALINDFDKNKTEKDNIIFTHYHIPQPLSNKVISEIKFKNIDELSTWLASFAPQHYESLIGNSIFIQIKTFDNLTYVCAHLSAEQHFALFKLFNINNHFNGMLCEFLNKDFKRSLNFIFGYLSDKDRQLFYHKNKENILNIIQVQHGYYHGNSSECVGKLLSLFNPAQYQIICQDIFEKISYKSLLDYNNIVAPLNLEQYQAILPYLMNLIKSILDDRDDNCCFDNPSPSYEKYIVLIDMLLNFDKLYLFDNFIKFTKPLKNITENFTIEQRDDFYKKYEKTFLNIIDNHPESGVILGEILSLFTSDGCNSICQHVFTENKRLSRGIDQYLAIISPLTHEQYQRVELFLCESIKQIMQNDDQTDLLISDNHLISNLVKLTPEKIFSFIAIILTAGTDLSFKDIVISKLSAENREILFLNYVKHKRVIFDIINKRFELLGQFLSLFDLTQQQIIAQDFFHQTKLKHSFKEYQIITDSLNAAQFKVVIPFLKDIILNIIKANQGATVFYDLFSKYPNDKKYALIECILMLNITLLSSAIVSFMKDLPSQLRETLYLNNKELFIKNTTCFDSSLHFGGFLALFEPSVCPTICEDYFSKYPCFTIINEYDLLITNLNLAQYQQVLPYLTKAFVNSLKQDTFLEPFKRANGSTSRLILSDTLIKRILAFIKHVIKQERLPSESLVILLPFYAPAECEEICNDFVKNHASSDLFNNDKKGFPYKTFAEYLSVTKNLSKDAFEKILPCLENTLHAIIADEQQRRLLCQHLNKNEYNASSLIKSMHNFLSLDEIGKLLKIDFALFAQLELTILKLIKKVEDYFALCAELCLDPFYEDNRRKIFLLLKNNVIFSDIIRMPADFLKFDYPNRNTIFKELLDQNTFREIIKNAHDFVSIYSKLEPEEKDQLFEYLHSRHYCLKKIITNIDDFFLIYEQLNERQQLNLYYNVSLDLFNNLLPMQIETCLERFKTNPEILKSFDDFPRKYVNTFKERCVAVTEASKTPFFKSQNNLPKTRNKTYIEQFTLIRNQAKKDNTLTKTIVDDMENKTFTKFSNL